MSKCRICQFLYRVLLQTFIECINIELTQNIWQGLCTCHVHASSEWQEVLVHVCLSLHDIVTTADPEWLCHVVKGRHKLSYSAQGVFLSFNQWGTPLYPCSGTIPYCLTNCLQY